MTASTWRIAWLVAVSPSQHSSLSVSMFVKHPSLLCKLGTRRIDGRVLLWVSMDVEVVWNPFLQWYWHWCRFSVILRGRAMLKFEHLCFCHNEMLIFSYFAFDVTNWVLHFFCFADRSFRGGTQAKLETSSDLWCQDFVSKSTYICTQAHWGASNFFDEYWTLNVTFILHLLNEEWTLHVSSILRNIDEEC